MLTDAYPLGRSSVNGGVEGVCFYLSQALGVLGAVELHVFVVGSERYGLRQPEVLQASGFTIHALPSRFPKWRVLSKTLFNPRRALERAGGFDLVHVQNEAIWAARAGAGGVLTIHGFNERDTLFRGPPWLRPLKGWANRQFHPRFRARVRDIISINPYVRTMLRPSPSQRLWDVENPVDDAFFGVVRAPVPGRVLYAGTLNARKNVLALITGFAQAARHSPAAELRLAGSEADRPYVESCRELAAGLGLGARVRFLGSLKVGQMCEELAGAEVFALCSLQETAPLAIAEAMASGVPVVASGVCGVPHMVAEGRTGWLADPSSPESVGRALQVALSHPGLDAVGREAKAIAERRFRASVVAAQTLHVYETVARDIHARR